MKELVKLLPLVGLILLCGNVFSTEPERITVRTHDNVTIHTDVSKGIKSFPEWGVFPDAQEDIRKITLFLTLAHPDTMPIAHWDYLDFIYLRRAGGKASDSLNIEIAKMITPYGSSFRNDWSFTWEVDVTDFAMLLRDSVEVDFLHTGYEPETLGWSLTLDFVFLFGPPVAVPISVSQLYLGSYPYGRPGDPIENHLKPYVFRFDDDSNFARLRIQQTGHGADRPNLCSEFCSRWREIWFNDELVDRRDLWKECGDNPLYPQGGTWIYDRGHWCPGDLQEPDIIHLPFTQGENVIRFAMQPYEAEDNIQAAEAIGAYLIQYHKPAHKNDVTLEQIKVPGNKDIYSRLNPACFTPIIKFRNNGSEVLRRLTIRYGTQGFNKKTFNWTGEVHHGEYETVYLPGEIDFNRGTNIFEVLLENPNGKKDEWVYDNSLLSEFTSPVELPLEFIVRYKTNNEPEENTLYILNNHNDTLYFRGPETSDANTIYNDTVSLKPGKYEFFLTDSGGDGLEFWAKPQSGYGYLRFLDMEGNNIHNFISDCGSGQFLAFNATSDAVRDLSVEQSSFFLYPRRTQRNLELDAWLVKESTLEVRFISDGNITSAHTFNSFKEGVINFDIGTFTPGRYIVEIYVDGELLHRNRINRDS